MGHRGNYAAVRDVQIMRNKEECVSDMEQSTSDAAAKDVKSKLFKPECTLGVAM